MSPTNSTPLPMPSPYNSPPVTVVLAVIILVFFFFGFFSVYFCRCIMASFLRAWYFRRSPSGIPVAAGCVSTARGLPPSHIRTFPTFEYSAVRDLRREKYGLECAICLCEFENDSMLRLLTLCYHVFHQECIDLWLESHNTCPVCRRILDPADNDVDTDLENDAGQDSVTIDVREDDDHDDRGIEGSSQSDVKKEEEEEEEHEQEQQEAKLSRSNTTGHSIVRSREEEDRYILRLPEHVKIRLLRGHNWTGSCTTFGDITKNKASGRFCGGDINKS